MTDEAQSMEEQPTDAPAEEAQEEAKTEYLEFLGTHPETYGTEFYKDQGTHSISKEHMKTFHDVDLGVEVATWKRGPNGRFLVPTADLNPAAVEVLAADPMFTLVKL